MITSSHQIHIMGELGQVPVNVFESCGKTCAVMYVSGSASIFFTAPSQIADLITQLTQLQTRFEAAIAAKAAAPVAERIDETRPA